MERTYFPWAVDFLCDFLWEEPGNSSRPNRDHPGRPGPGPETGPRGSGGSSDRGPWTPPGPGRGGWAGPPESRTPQGGLGEKVLRGQDGAGEAVPQGGEEGAGAGGHPQGGAGARPEHVLAEHPVPAEPAAMEQQAAPVIDAGDQDHGPPSFFGNSTFVLGVPVDCSRDGAKIPEEKKKFFSVPRKGGPP